MTSEVSHPLHDQFTTLLTTLHSLSGNPASTLTRDDLETALELV